MSNEDWDRRLRDVGSMMAAWMCADPDAADQIQEDAMSAFWKALTDGGRRPIELVFTEWETKGGPGEIFLGCWERALRDHGAVAVLLAQMSNEPQDFGTCEVCGAKITAAEDGKLQRDIDFVEHNGHLIRRVWND